MSRTRKRIGIMIGFLIVFSIFLTACGKQGTEIVLEQTEEMKIEETEMEESKPEKEPASIWIDVSGAVKNPGVYQLAEGARVFEAIGAAGGFTEQADAQWMNQAQVLKDGEKVQVYTKEETKTMREKEATFGGTQDQQDSGKINLNLATVEELQRIPGIGEARAQAIIDYREEHGGFQRVEEIQKISGIKGKTYEKLADYVCIK